MLHHPVWIDKSYLELLLFLVFFLLFFVHLREGLHDNCEEKIQQEKGTNDYKDGEI